MKRIIVLVMVVCFINTLCIGCSLKESREELIVNDYVQINNTANGQETENDILDDSIIENAEEENSEATSINEMEIIEQKEEDLSEQEEEVSQEKIAQEKAVQEKVPIDKQIIMTNSVEIEGQSVETQDYAIYPSNITEKNENNTNQYIWSERNIDITCPQIYFSNEYEQYDSDIETEINKELFMQSLMNDESFFVGRDTRGLVEYDMDYVITKANEYIFSIQYIGQLYSVEHGYNMCSGITVDIRTGEKIDLSEIVTIDNTLIDKLKNKEIEYIDSTGYEEEIIIELVEEFMTDYQAELLDTYNCYFLEDNIINLIVPMSYGNTNYIILKLPIEYLSL